MITLKKIKTTLNKKLISNFSDIDVSSKSANEGFERPSFKVELDNVKREGSLTQVEKSCTVRIFYFPSKDDDNAAEMLDIREELGDLFDLKFTVEGRHLDIVDSNFDEIDGVLQFEFDIAFEEGRNREYTVPQEQGVIIEDPELMQELEMKMKRS